MKKKKLVALSLLLGGVLGFGAWNFGAQAEETFIYPTIKPSSDYLSAKNQDTFTISGECGSLAKKAVVIPIQPDYSLPDGDVPGSEMTEDWNMNSHFDNIMAVYAGTFGSSSNEPQFTLQIGNVTRIVTCDGNGNYTTGPFSPEEIEKMRDGDGEVEVKAVIPGKQTGSSYFYKAFYPPEIDQPQNLTPETRADFKITGKCTTFVSDHGGGADEISPDEEEDWGPAINTSEKTLATDDPRPTILIGGLERAVECKPDNSFEVGGFSDEEIEKMRPDNGTVTVTLKVPHYEDVETAFEKKFPYGTVKVRYVDDKNQPIADEEILLENQKVGTPYKVDAKDIEDYNIQHRDPASAPHEGEVKEGEQVVVFVYAKKRGTVKVQYVDKTGTPIADEELLQDNVEVKTPYESVAKEIEGYTFVEHKADSAPQNGLVKEGEQVVVLVYEKKEEPKKPDQPGGDSGNNPGNNPGDDSGNNPGEEPKKPDQPNQPEEPKKLTFNSKKIRVRRHSHQPGIPVETEVDGKNIKIETDKLPEGLEFDPTTKTIKGKVNGRTGFYRVPITVRDNDGNEAEGTLDIEVYSRSSSGNYSTPTAEVKNPDEKPESTPEKKEEPKTPETPETPKAPETPSVPVMADPIVYRIPETSTTETPKIETPTTNSVSDPVPVSVEQNTKIKTYVKVLPKTGVLSAGDLQKKVGIRKNAKVETNLPSEETFKLAGSTDANLAHWLQVLPKKDQKADQYIVLPKQGLVMPVHGVAEHSKAYNNFINGRTENFLPQLHNGAVQLPGTSLGTYGQAGNKVIAGHSSYWKNSAARYKTHFQKIIGMETGEQIWIYQKTANGSYERFVYSVNASYNTADTDISVIKPTTNDQLTLMTCTPIGGVAGRWIVKATFIGH